MAKLRIPESHREGFKFLIELKETEFQKLTKVLEGVEKGILPDELASKINNETSFELITAQEIARILFSLYPLKERFNDNIEELSKELIVAFKNAKVELDTKPNWEEVEVRIKKLLSYNSTIGNTFKALKLSTEFSKIYIDSRIITDIRPTFSDDDELLTNSALITHSLKFEYQEDDRHEELFLTLDSKDLDELKRQIERAKNKEEKLKTILKDKFHFISPSSL